MARRISFKEGVFTAFADNCRAESADDVKIRQELTSLGAQPERGFSIPFANPLFYQLPIPPFVAHYIFDDEDVTILYLGIPGKC